MLTEFHFDEDFLAANDLNGKNSNMVNNMLLDFWLERGCLLYPFSELKNYQEWEDTIPAKYSKKWVTALTHARTYDISKLYKKTVSFENINQLESLYKPTGLELILVPNEFTSLGLLDENDSIVFESLEISKINGLLKSNSYSKSITLCNQGIKVGDEIEKIWMLQFQKTAKYSKVITIIDRYFGANLSEDIGRHKREVALDRFVKLLSREGRKFNITICTVGGERDSELYNEITNYLRKKIASNIQFKNTISNITIFSCDDKNFQKFGHDRFICFDNIVYEIGKGFDIFRDLPLFSSTLSIKSSSHSNFKYSLGELLSRRLWTEEF
ncbi:hypothetical protein JOE25_003236 [Serratia sp. PL17]|uniref:hypothetical protein n=1 Tax=Serratia sp. PL17 TaxID=2806582 RepID=UPI001AE4A859|nr:hypothetical protein [Serratia sp. PL17]MBP1131656.1 hypothetical protein [Serratia sp. PL17]